MSSIFNASMLVEVTAIDRLIRMEPNIAKIASLLGDSARAKIMTALMGGKALTATELATIGDITPQTASSHLAKLLEGGLLLVRKQGRHKYFQLKDAQVAELIETLLNVSAQLNVDLQTGPNDHRLRNARVCYDHLAGELGVKLFNSLVSDGLIAELDAEARLTIRGEEFFSSLGVDVASLEKASRPLCKSCLDWSERKSHLAGNLGKWILDDALERKWLKRSLDSRAIEVSPTGLKAFAKKYQLLA